MPHFEQLVAAACNTGFLCSPLNPQLSTIPGFVSAVLKAVVAIALPLISLAFVYSGFMFVIARGNAEALKKARTNFLYVVVGAALILGAWILAELIGSTISQLTA